MRKDTYKEIRTEVEDLLTDFGFVDPDLAVSQLKSIFEVQDEDIIESCLLRGKSLYEVHYDNYVITICIDRYEFKIVDIEEYNDEI